MAKNGKTIQNKSGRGRGLLKRWFIDGLSYMALGLFASLIVGLILGQISKITIGSFNLGVLNQFATVAKNNYVVGAAIGAAIALGLKSASLVVFASAVAGAIGYQNGGPVGAFLASIIGAELGNLISGRTPIDIILTPLTVIIAGGFIAIWVGPPLNEFMTWLGQVIMSATDLAPIPMGIAIAVLVGMILTAPISSAALCIMLGLGGLAAGAATVGCCCQMVGFAVISYKDNGFGGILAQGLGTSMLQVPNIVRRPLIWIPPIIASAIIGPFATTLFKMVNTPVGAGMGTAGLVGQFGTIEAMGSTWDVFLKIGVLHVVAPAILTFLIYKGMRRAGWIKDGDMTLTTK